MFHAEANVPGGDSQPGPLDGGAPAEQAARFLELLFGEAEQGHLSLWRGDTKASIHFALPTDFHAVAEQALSLAETTDVYFGVGLRERDYGHGARGSADGIIAIPGLWADVDVAGPGHKVKDLPPDLETATVWLKTDLEFPPSLVVASGGGLHPYWLFKELWTLDDDAERRAAAETVAGWQTHVAEIAAARGWRLDLTHDLARVLRVPRTRNHKTTPPRPVGITQVWDRRYNPSDFAPYRRAVEACRRGQGAQTEDKIPEGQRNAALTSLAGTMRRRGMAEASIVAALLAENRARCEPPLPEADVRRIARSVAQYPPDRVPDTSVEALARISAALQLDVARVLKLGTDDSVYDLVLADGRRITLGHAADVLSPTKVRGAILDAAGVVIRRFKAERWDEVAEAIATAAELVDTGSRGEIFRAHLASFLAEQPQTKYDLTNTAVKRELITAGAGAFQDTGANWWIQSAALQRYLAFNAGTPWTEKQLADALHRFGCVRDRLEAREGDRVLTSRRWITPAAIIDEAL